MDDFERNQEVRSEKGEDQVKQSSLIKLRNPASPFIAQLIEGARRSAQKTFSEAEQQLIEELVRTPYRIDGANSSALLGIQTLKHHSEYLARIAPKDSAKNLIEFLEELNDLEEFLRQKGDDTSPLPLLRHVYSYNERLAIVPAHLYSEKERIPIQIHGWFVDTLHRLDEAYIHATHYFATLQERCREDQQLLGRFLESLRKEMGDFIIASTNMATMFALHAQEEDCAVYVGTTPYAAKGEGAHEPMHQLFQYPIYQKYNAHMLECHGIHGDTVDIPTYVSAVDIEEFAKAWSSFWQAMASSTERKYSSRSRLIHQFRTHATSDAQARIRFMLRGGEYDGFNVRVDREEYVKHDPHLSVDIGGIDWRQAYGYADELGRKSKTSDIVMGYKDILDQRGHHAHLEDPRNPYPKNVERYYPSVMKSRALPGIDQKMALVAAVIMCQGRDIGLFQGKIFGYHNKGSRIDNPEYRREFPGIVQSYRALVGS